MNWLALFGPLLLGVFKRLIDRAKDPAVFAASIRGAGPVADCNALADQLEAAVQQHAPKGAAVGSDGGIVSHITALVAALRSGDWDAIQTAFLDIFSHL